MTWPYKALLVILLMIGSAAAGFFARKPETVTVTEVQTQVKEIEKIKTQIVKEKVKLPDGTTRETTTTNTIQATTTEANQSQHQAMVVPSATTPSDWSVGVKWRADFRDPTWVPAAAEIGYRIYGPAWGTAEVIWADRIALIGVRIDL